MSSDTKQNDINEAVEAIESAEKQSPRREATVMELATIIAESRCFASVGIRTPAQAAVPILAGREMGIGPIASVIGIRVQNGRVSMDAALMASCIERSQCYGYRIDEHDNEHCKIKFWKYDSRASEGIVSLGPSEFTIADAKTAGLANKDTWRNYPRNMLFARALSNGARWYCAGIFGGAIYTHEELGIATDDEGRPIEFEAGEGGNELCTLAQRQEICRLVESVGDSMPGFLAKCGIRLLDELSQGEAAKEIKKLEKRTCKTNGNTPPVVQQTQTPPAETKLATPAQQTLIDAYGEASTPSTPQQRERILELAEKAEPDEEKCRQMIKNALARRSKTKLAELDSLQASAMIEKLEQALAADPPFDPTPEKSGN